LQVKVYVDDPLVWHGRLKAGWVKALFDAEAQIRHEISSIRLPLLTLHGTADRVTNIASSQFLYDYVQSEDKAFEVRTCVH